MDPTTNPTPPADEPAATGQPNTGRGAREEVTQVRAIARAVDRNARKTTELNEQVRRLADDVARLVGIVTTPPLFPPPAPPAEHPPVGDGADEKPAEVVAGGGGEPPAAVRSWLLASDPELAVADVADLVEWLDRVYLRFPGAELGGCWLWHPHVIEELWWLRRAHADALDREQGSWLRVGDWHDRQRPGVVRRVHEALSKCDLSLHAPGRAQGHGSTVAPLVAHAAALAVEWATTSTRPAPSPEQLSAAGEYAAALHRRAR